MTRALRRDTNGVVFAEFLMAFFCFFTLFVSTLQLSFVAAARLVVQHAAVQAVRAAVVTIDDDPYFYEDGTRKHLERAGNGQDASYMARALAYLTELPASSFNGLGAKGTERLNRVRGAAYLPLSVISPTETQVAAMIPFATTVWAGAGERSLASDLGTVPLLRIATGFAVYGRVASAIVFPVAPGSDELRDPGDAVFVDDELVTVRVVYLLPCNVPIARSIVCKSLFEMTGLPAAFEQTLAAVGPPNLQSLSTLEDVWKKQFPADWSRFTSDVGELSSAEWFALQLPLYAMDDQKFVVLRAEATLPNHGAAYKYYSELKPAEEAQP